MLKKGNRAYFERLLKQNIMAKLRCHATEGRLNNRRGRYYLETGLSEEKVSGILASTPGIVGFSRAVRTEKDLESLVKASIALARDEWEKGAGRLFKVEVRRTDKSLPMNSYGYAREIGAALLEAIPQLTVDVHHPDFVISVELRERGYLYSDAKAGPGGLPVGSGGRGMLLLSGGIDSPVAGYLMARRGVRLFAVHFHTPPFTSPEAHEKALRLAALLAPWCGGLTLYSVSFTPCQLKINQSVHPSATTLHTRACMMQIAENLAQSRGCLALISGESLGQVASQTMESLAFTNSMTELPVFRPLIGMDKEDIISTARRIGTYETAIEPHEDCCTLFSPEKPLTRPNAEAESGVYQSIEGLADLMESAAESAVRTAFDALGKRM